jgi:DNA-binding transcriptional LysR family regulator
MSYDNLDLNLLKIFMSVYENKGIVLASKKLYVSQPAVTKSIQKLEEFVGGKLFVRMPKGVVPTTEAKEFYELIKSSNNLIERAIDNYKSYAKLEKGSLNIGSSSTIIRYLLTAFITEFSKRHPNIKITITDGISSQLTNFLRKGEVDLAILSLPLQNTEIFDQTKITQTTDCFIVAKDFSKDFLTKKEISNYPLLVQKRPSNNRDSFEQMCLENDIVLNPAYEMTSFGLITDFTEKNMGIGYTIKDFVQNDLKTNRVKELKTDFKIIPRDVVILTIKAGIYNYPTRIFIKEIKENFNKKTAE